MTNNDLINLFRGLDKLKDLKGIKFSYFVCKLKMALMPEMNALDLANPQLLETFKDRTNDEKKELIISFFELLNQENDITLPTIKIEDIPENISVEQMDIIKQLIKEE